MKHREIVIIKESIYVAQKSETIYLAVGNLVKYSKNGTDYYYGNLVKRGNKSNIEYSPCVIHFQLSKIISSIEDVYYNHNFIDTDEMNNYTNKYIETKFDIPKKDKK